jgi:hypothetical protein
MIVAASVTAADGCTTTGGAVISSAAVTAVAFVCSCSRQSSLIRPAGSCGSVCL